MTKIKQNMQPLGIKIDDQLKARVQAIADRDDRSMSSVVRRAIEKGLPFFEQGVIHPKKNLDKVSSTH
jgi:predicted transcriptional regulator